MCAGCRCERELELQQFQTTAPAPEQPAARQFVFLLWPAVHPVGNFRGNGTRHPVTNEPANRPTIEIRVSGRVMLSELNESLKMPTLRRLDLVRFSLLQSLRALVTLTGGTT